MDEVEIERQAKQMNREAGTLDDGVNIIPVIEEKATVQTYTHDIGIVSIQKTVHERTQVVDQQRSWEEVEVERIAVNRIVDAPIPVRHEGDTMIISLLEEVVVVEKRLLLREEVHIRKLRKEEHDAKEVHLREERVEIVREEDSRESSRHNEAGSLNS